MDLSQRLGKIASSLQVAATFLDSRLCETVPFFGWFPRLIGGVLFVLSGLFWTLEMLTQPLPPQTSRWDHFCDQISHLFTPGKGIKSLTFGTLASTCTTIAGAITIACLYAAGGPLFWVTSGLAVVGGLAWYKTDEPEENKQSTASQQFNHIAAGAQIISALCFMGGLAFPPAAPILHIVALAFAFLSSTSWVASYFIKDEVDLSVNMKPKPLTYTAPDQLNMTSSPSANPYLNNPNPSPTLSLTSF